MTDNLKRERSLLMDDLVNDLRDGLEENGSITNSTPKVRRISYFSAKFQDIKYLKPFLIRGLILFLAILLIGQIYYVTITLPKLNDGGPITVSAAIEQIEQDLEPPPVPPPSLR